MPYWTKQWLVSTDWLDQHLNAPDLVVLDASWHLPQEGRDARAEYVAEHIPGALFFDIDELSDTENPLPHMLPNPIKFSSRMRKMGIGDGMRIVVYDTKGIYSAARAWWTFRVMGVQDVAVLNGGLKKWKAEGRAVDDRPPARRFERHFSPRRQADLVYELSDVQRALAEGSAQVVDARSAGRFHGQEPEPRPGVRSGHIPGSRNVPSTELLQSDGTLKSEAELQALFAANGVSLTNPVVTTCGSGITASILALALMVAGNRQVGVYDGSWAEWGANMTLPAATGAMV